MVCLACLLPLFLIPVVNALPLLFYFIVGKIYWLFGWEYRKPERVPPTCPYKPASKKIIDSMTAVTTHSNSLSTWELYGMAQARRCHQWNLRDLVQSVTKMNNHSQLGLLLEHICIRLLLQSKLVIDSMHAKINLYLRPE
ncbi:hypothetical protein MUK42_12556 [Musa troglodytarum]|uniref:Uncharacterized protein n=1 Tax=Musa troglodytarum TaxID=320322 RepID=A0A9E7GF57_9LILI|nr:hypothetical protein MUK42_12556 [Musa troglodytarum]